MVSVVHSERKEGYQWIFMPFLTLFAKRLVASLLCVLHCDPKGIGRIPSVGKTAVNNLRWLLHCCPCCFTEYNIHLQANVNVGKWPLNIHLVQ